MNWIVAIYLVPGRASAYLVVEVRMNDLMIRSFAALIQRSQLQEMAVSERVGHLIWSYDNALTTLRMSSIPLREREEIRRQLKARLDDMMTGLLEG